MKSLEQINDRFLKIAAEVNEYTRYLELQDRWLRQSLRVIDQTALSKLKKYIVDHKDSVKQNEKWAKEEWKRICDSRMFDYKELGELITTFLTQKEGIPYFSATRLVKHSFQVDEVNRPFYRVVSFVTSNAADLKAMVLESLAPTMIPYYVGMSPIMKPLPRELDSLTGFEQMVKRELEARESTELYAVTDTDIPKGAAFQKPENQAMLKTFPFGYINAMIDACILRKYYQGSLNPHDIEEVIKEFCTKQVSLII